MIQCYKKKVNITTGDNPGEYYYAAFSRKGTADSIALAEQMKEGSSAFTRGEVVGITLDLPAHIKQAILNGQAVKINGLGTFKPSLTVSKVQADPDDLKTSAISIKSINFAPDAELLSDLNAQAEYQWISASAAADEDTNDETTTGGTGNENGGTETPNTNLDV